MSVERSKILDMFKKGVITQEEALDLLSALDEEKAYTEAEQSANESGTDGSSEDLIRLIQSMPEDQRICDLINEAVKKGVKPSELILIMNYLPAKYECAVLVINAMKKGVKADQIIKIMPHLSDEEEKCQKMLDMLIRENAGKNKKFFNESVNFDIDKDTVMNVADKTAKAAIKFAGMVSNTLFEGFKEFKSAAEKVGKQWNAQACNDPEKEESFKIINANFADINVGLSEIISKEDYDVTIESSPDENIYVQLQPTNGFDLTGVCRSENAEQAQTVEEKTSGDKEVYEAVSSDEETTRSEEKQDSSESGVQKPIYVIDASGSGIYIDVKMIKAGNSVVPVDAANRIIKIKLPKDINMRLTRFGKGNTTANVDFGAVEAKISGCNKVMGNINAKDADITISGYSTVHVGNVGGECKANISGASKMFCGDILGNTDINVSGASAFEGGSIKCTEAKITNSGASNCTVKRFETDNLQCSISGAGNTTINEGEIVRFKASASGAGSLVIRCQCNEGVVEASGTSSVHVTKVTGDFKQTITGVATVTAGK